MTKIEKLLLQILSGKYDKNISFSSLTQLLEKFGFKIRIKGDHHIFTHNGVLEILNLQPKGSKAKPYQIKQVRNMILKYKFGDIHNVE